MKTNNLIGYVGDTTKPEFKEIEEALANNSLKLKMQYDYLDPLNLSLVKPQINSNVYIYEVTDNANSSCNFTTNRV